MKNLLSVNQVAFILHVHPLSVRRYIKEGKLKAIKIGGNIRIEENALNEMQSSPNPTPTRIVIQKAKKVPLKQFDQDDPFMHLKGRGASLT